jgi:Serine dehydrogenase proteinase
MATRAERVEKIEALQQARDGTTVISYVTSTRPNLEAPMAMDVVPIIYRHLQRLSGQPKERRIDLFIHSNGGDGIVPWRLVTLLREFCSELVVLIPHRAFSAATLTALGADRVIMHPMGMLGPTDRTVTNPFNPSNPENPAQTLGISVEDVASYIALVRDDVGIRHEDELVQAFSLLAERIHPLALGNVKRATSQSRMLGLKLLREQGGAEKLDEREVEEITEKLTSQLYFHGHPINRREAREDLRLSFVESAKRDVEAAMWGLYELYAEEMRLDDEFLPLQEVYSATTLQHPDPPQMVMPGQIGVAEINVASETIGPLPMVYVETVARADKRAATFEVTVRKEWTGVLNANVALTSSGWEEAV